MRGEPAQVLVEMDDAERVDVPGLKSAVERDDAGGGGEHVVGHALQEGPGELLLHGAVDNRELNSAEAGLGGAFEILGAVGGQQQVQALSGRAEAEPVERFLEQQQDGVGLFG